jgi:hypothetical protein
MFDTFRLRDLYEMLLVDAALECGTLKVLKSRTSAVEGLRSSKLCAGMY